MTEPIIVLDPWPRSAGQIFDHGQRERLAALGTVVACDSRQDPEGFERILPQAAAILGQPDLPPERLERALSLRALINVEGNFFPNVDYGRCLERGIAVLNIAPAFAVPVAEMTIALALDLARGVTLADGAMRAGNELYGSKSGAGSMLLSRSQVGIVGYGSIGRALRQLLRGFSARVSVYDPWLPAGLLLEDDCAPMALPDLLETCDFILVCAAATKQNRHLLGRAELERIRPGAALVLVSRADVVDFGPLVELVNAGRFKAATDVFPNEPVPADDPIRQSRLLLSPHRAGGMRAALATAAEMILDDLELIFKGLPALRLQQARRETIGLAASKPAAYR